MSIEPENLLERLVETEKEAAVATARLNTINGQLGRNADAMEALAEKQTEVDQKMTKLEGVIEVHKAENVGEHKATRKELRLIGLAVAAATIVSKFIPTPAPDAVHSAFRLLGLG